MQWPARGQGQGFKGGVKSKGTRLPDMGIKSRYRLDKRERGQHHLYLQVPRKPEDVLTSKQDKAIDVVVHWIDLTQNVA